MPAYREQLDLLRSGKPPASEKEAADEEEMQVADKEEDDEGEEEDEEDEEDDEPAEEEEAETPAAKEPAAGSQQSKKRKKGGEVSAAPQTTQLSHAPCRDHDPFPTLRGKAWDATLRRKAWGLRHPCILLTVSVEKTTRLAAYGSQAYMYQSSRLTSASYIPFTTHTTRRCLVGRRALTTVSWLLLLLLWLVPGCRGGGGEGACEGDDAAEGPEVVPHHEAEAGQAGRARAHAADQEAEAGGEEEVERAGDTVLCCTA